jgi:hypothetical protein
MARFNAPPGWPPPPLGWAPPPGWQPHPTWPPAPQGWPFWVEDGAVAYRGPDGAYLFRPPSPPSPPAPWPRRLWARLVGFLVLPYLAPRAVRRPRGRLRPATALGIVAGVYLLGFGAADVSEVVSSAANRPVGPTRALSVADLVPAYAERWSLSIAAVVVALLVAQRRGIRLADLGVRPRWARHRPVGASQVVIIAVLYFAAILVAGLIVRIPQSHNPWTELAHVGNVGVGLQLVDAFISGGLLEEVVVVAFTVRILQQGRIHWTWIVVASVGMRVAFHVYYGAAAIGWAGIWATGAVLLYLWTGRLTALIAAHTIVDIIATLSLAGHLGVIAPVVGLAMFGAAIFVLAMIWPAGLRHSRLLVKMADARYGRAPHSGRVTTST